MKIWNEQIEQVEENELPDIVKSCSKLIAYSGVWWCASRNHNGINAESCMHAIKQRVRLGSGDNGGIPLWAELKSSIGIADNSTNESKYYFAVHTRANTVFNKQLITEAIKKHLNNDVDFNTLKFSFESKKKLHDQKNFGKVNPFNIDKILGDEIKQPVKQEEIIHIFDKSIEMDGGIPNTVMSNLGHKQYAFELHPNDLITIIKGISKKCIVENISEPCKIWLGKKGKHLKNYWLQFPPPTGPMVGILTGNSPESGLFLCETFLNFFRKAYIHLSDVLMPEIHIHSLPHMGLSMDLINRGTYVWMEIKKAIVEMLERGCKLITIACNTTIYYEPQINDLCKKYKDVQFISIAEACVPTITKELRSKNGLKSVGLLGVGTVINMKDNYSGYKKYLEKTGLKVIPCEGDEIAYAVKNMGVKDTPKIKNKKKHATINKFKNIIQNKFTDCSLVIIALTEASILYNEYQKTHFKNFMPNTRFVDPLHELGKYLVFQYISQGYIKCNVCQIPDSINVKQRIKELIYYNQIK